MAFQETIIEYLDNGKFVCAFVFAESGKRLSIVNQNGRDVNLPVSRVVHKTARQKTGEKGRDGILKSLQEISAIRQGLMTMVDLEAIWNLVIEEKETVFSPIFLTELCFGKEATDDHIAAFLRSVFADRLYFKYKDGKVLCHSRETVEQLLERCEKERLKEQFLVDGVSGINNIWLGNEAQNDNWPERDPTLQLIKEYYLFGNEAPDSDVARELTKKSMLSLPHDSFHLLVKAGVWDKNENIFLERHGITKTFSAESLSEAHSLAEPDVETLQAEGRKDFRHLPLLTIDGQTTRDFDDALHVEQREGKYHVGIHVADVTRFIKPNSILFQEALHRGTSIYFPEGSLPMLPRTLSEGVLSLIAQKTRGALSFMVVLSSEGEVLDFTITTSVVCVKRQLNYNEVDQLIGSDKELTALSMLSMKLRERRLANGALILPFPDLIIQIGKADSIHVSLADSDTPSRILVSEFMILANTLAAQFLADRETPGLFRGQPAPRKRLSEGYTKDLFSNIRQRKQLSPMVLSVKPNPHSSLGVPQYTTVTSPIRRMLDLIIQHQLIHLLTRNGPLFSKNELKSFAATLNDDLLRANTAKQLRQRYWLLKFLQSKKGQEVRGLVIDKGARRTHVLLTDYLLDTDLPTSQAADTVPGDIISVQITKIDALGNILQIERR